MEAQIKASTFCHQSDYCCHTVSQFLGRQCFSLGTGPIYAFFPDTSYLVLSFPPNVSRSDKLLDQFRLIWPCTQASAHVAFPKFCRFSATTGTLSTKSPVSNFAYISSASLEMLQAHSQTDSSCDRNMSTSATFRRKPVIDYHTWSSRTPERL